MFSFLLTFLIIGTVVAQAINFYYLHTHQRVIYPLIIGVYVGYGIIELALAVRGGWQMWVGLFVLLDAYAVLTAVAGWRNW